MFRMGRKYKIPAFYNQAKASLLKEIPTTMEMGQGKKPGTEIKFPSEIDMLNLAVENEVLAILPMLYWRIAIRKVVSRRKLSYVTRLLHMTHLLNLQETIFAGEARPDGTIAYLSPEAFYTTIVGRNRMVQDNSRHAEWIFKLGKNNDCTSMGRCHEAADRLLYSICIPDGTKTSKFLRGMRHCLSF